MHRPIITYVHTACRSPLKNHQKEKKRKKFRAFLLFLLFFFLFTPPLLNKSPFEAHTRRCSFRRASRTSKNKLWEKVPGRLLFYEEHAETRRHRSTAADLRALAQPRHLPCLLLNSSFFVLFFSGTNLVFPFVSVAGRLWMKIRVRAGSATTGNRGEFGEGTKGLDGRWTFRCSFAVVVSGAEDLLSRSIGMRLPGCVTAAWLLDGAHS